MKLQWYYFNCWAIWRSVYEEWFDHYFWPSTVTLQFTNDSETLLDFRGISIHTSQPTFRPVFPRHAPNGGGRGEKSSVFHIQVNSHAFECVNEKLYTWWKYNNNSNKQWEPVNNEGNNLNCSPKGNSGATSWVSHTNLTADTLIWLDYSMKHIGVKKKKKGRSILIQRWLVFHMHCFSFSWSPASLCTEATMHCQSQRHPIPSRDMNNKYILWIGLP